MRLTPRVSFSRGYFLPWKRILKSFYDHSDTGNAELINDLSEENIRYDADSQRWLQWNSGHRWYKLEESEQYKLAIKAANYRFSVSTGENEKSEQNFATLSRNENKLRAALNLARHLPPIGNVGVDWDAKPNLLSVGNGVVNLDTGQLRAGYRTDYISQGIKVPYDPSATCPLFEKFISEIMCGNPEYISFLQRAIGYSLTGSTKEQVFFILHGTGENGKGTLMYVLEQLLADFVQTVRFSAFEEKANSGEKLDFASLPGVRIAFSSEGNDLKTINSATIKDITGQDRIVARRLYQHPFTFTPQFKLWVVTNHRPKFLDDSDALWRRVILIPFAAKFSGVHRDNDLRDKLRAELPGILAWAIQGAIRWNRQGISTPDSLLIEINKYRQESDELEQFITEHYTREDLETTRAGLFYEQYKVWAIDCGNTPMTSTAFGRKMATKFEKLTDKYGTYYRGVKFKAFPV